MPHVLWELQGWQDLNHDQGHAEEDHDSHGAEGNSPFTLVQAGSLTEEEYDKAITDLVNFMIYLSEPAQLKRKTIGKGVLFFLAFLPQFVNTNTPPVWTQMVFYGVSFTLLVVIVFGAIGLFAGTAASVLSPDKRGRGYFRWITAAVFVLLALKLFFTQR